MPEIATLSGRAGPGGIMTLEAARQSAREAGPDAPLSTLLCWVEDYLMKGHVDLGRTGAVCPFTRQAARLDTVRLGISDERAAGEEAAFAQVRSGFSTLDAIPCKPGMRHFRTVIIGFPKCDTPDGIAMLKRVQDRHKLYSLRRNRMIGLMHATSEAPGLWNSDFRPLRAPLPVIAIRHMVEHDAPFAARHPLLLLPYLARFPIAGSKRLIAHLRAGAQ